MTKVIPIVEESWDPDLIEEGHTCPYREEIFDDHTTMCHCDEESTRQCAEDI